MCELTDILGIDLKLLAANGVAWPCIRTDRFWSSCASRAEGVEEFVLAFGWMCGEIGTRTGIFLLQIVPLVLLARAHGAKKILTCILVFCAPR